MQGIFIFVLDRGFVVVGDARPSSEIAGHWYMARSVTVRRWGTSKGLAELQDGPTSETQLDDVCMRTTPFRSVLDVIHVTPKGAQRWKSLLYAQPATR